MVKYVLMAKKSQTSGERKLGQMSRWFGFRSDHSDLVRVHVTPEINENDSALKLSRAKLGSQQLARLGHFPYELNSGRAVYVNFTDARSVGDSHSYYEGKPLANAAVKKFFRQAFNGEVAEKPLKYDPSRNLHNF